MTDSKMVDYLNGPLPADQQSYDDVRDMIRAMFAVCNLEAHHWRLPGVDTDGNLADLASDTRWLRSYFLDSVEFALDSEAEPDTLFDDFGEETQGIEFGLDSGPDWMQRWVRIETRFDGRCADGDYAFSLTCTNSDDDAVWLESEAMADRDNVLAAIAEARQAIGF